MKKNRENLSRVFRIVLLVGIFFTLLISIAYAYSYDDYYEDREEEIWSEEEDVNEWDDDAVSYYDYAGQWHEIPDPDPYYYPASYEHSRGHRSSNPISTMMPMLIVFFVVFLSWLAYVLGRDGN